MLSVEPERGTRRPGMDVLDDEEAPVEAPFLEPEHSAQQALRGQRLGASLTICTAVLASCALALAWAPASSRGSATVADTRAEEVLELNSLPRFGSDLIMNKPSKAMSPPPYALVLNKAGEVVNKFLTAKAHDMTPWQKCKAPVPIPVHSTSGPRCQHSVFADRKDGSILAVNILMHPWDLAFLNSDPKRREYRPCNVTVNYHQRKEETFVGGKCRYKGQTGSFMGCLDKDGRADFRKQECRKLSLKVKLSKAVTEGRRPREAKKVLGIRELQLKGAMHDDSLLRLHMGWSVLHSLGAVASCSAPTNVYMNGLYDGIADLIEAVDESFTQQRFRNDEFKGKGTLYKELWPESPNPAWYAHVKEIPDFADRELKHEGPGGKYHHLFANLYREAKACFDDGSKSCTALRASMILNKYTHPDSFLDAFLGMTLTANSDQILILNHNYYLYIMDGKFYYLSWDYNQVLYDLTGSPIPGYEIPYPWYEILDDHQRKQVCPFSVPSNRSDLSTKRFRHFTCDPVGFIMAKAWKHRFLARLRALDQRSLVRQFEHEVNTWSRKMASSVSCDAANGGWPPSASVQMKAAKLLAPAFDKVVTFWKSVGAGTLQEWPTPTFQDFGREVAGCIFDALTATQYLGQAGIAIAEGVRDCDHGEDGVSACTSDISNVIASFGFVATFLSEMLHTCPIQDKIGFAQRGVGALYKSTFQAECAEQSSRLIASLASISAGASGLSEMCVPGKARENRGLPAATGRRLDSVGFVKSRGTEVASCVFDTMGASFYLARAGIVIDRAAQVCNSPFESPARCASSVSAVIEAFGYVGMFLANSVAQCAREEDFPLDQAFEAACAADIAQLVAALGGVAEAGSGMAVSCGKEELPFDIEFGHHGFRHLSPSSFAAQLNASKVAFHGMAKGDRRMLSEWVEMHEGPSGYADGRAPNFG